MRGHERDMKIQEDTDVKNASSTKVNGVLRVALWYPFSSPVFLLFFV